MIESNDVEDILDEIRNSRVVSSTILFATSYSFRVIVKTVFWKFSFLSYPFSLYIECETGTGGTYWSIDANFRMKLAMLDTDEEIWTNDITEKFYLSKKMICQLGQMKTVPANGTKLRFEVTTTISKVQNLFPFPDHTLDHLLRDNESSVIFLINDRKIRVNRKYLSFYSPVFEAMFNSDFLEKNQKEIEIKDISMDDFMEFLRILHFQKMFSDESSKVIEVIEIADRFQVQCVMRYCEKKLTKAYKNGTTTLNCSDMLLISDEYKLNSLQASISEWIKSNKYKSILYQEGFTRLSKEAQLAVYQALV